MPAFAMEIVCCSMASWMATWSLTSILSNSSMQQMPLSASISAPASMQNSLLSDSCAPSSQLWGTFECCSVGISHTLCGLGLRFRVGGPRLQLNNEGAHPDTQYRALRRRQDPVLLQAAEHGKTGGECTLTTVAVRPAAEDDLPEVYTARGRKPATYFRSWLLAHDGSPTMATLMSPRRLIPCANRMDQPGS